MSDASETPTGTAPRPPSSTPRPSGSSGGGASGSGGRAHVTAQPPRFAAGEVIGDRYRIVSLLGRGGMGEVYRADDLKLEQPVALKFLAEAVEADPERLSRFYNEAKLARQVTHPAVCRVHDIGEVDGHPFLSMELVDGEDLGSLLKRIGRLSADKATELARQICAGVAAAHARGVLHRDLKPGNVMIDGQGHARITDFGLAGLAEWIRGEDVRSGTPAYMSPEQLEGREVTTRSDLYSLGLLLYELFSGRRAFQGRTLAEVMRHRAERPAPLAELVPELDPRLAAVVERCLDRDPSRRPASALVVAASLGGDPLASALAEGHTPSPEMVAAAGEVEGRMAPAAAWTALGLAVATVVLVPVLYAPLQLVARVPMTRPAAVLEDRAREVVARLGYEPEPLDRAVGWVVDRDYFTHTKGIDGSPSRWDALATGAPAVLQFWYRQSPRALVSQASTGKIYWGEPSWWVSGSIQMRLDTRGRLLSFYAIPPQVDPRPGETSPAPADFAPLFEEAGLDMARFEPVPSQWAPPFESDVRLAWEGSWPERPEIAVRIEGASYRGRPVAFYPVAPWTRPHHDVPFFQGAADRVANAATIAVFVVLVTVAGFLARRHLRTGRADRAGAAKVSLAVFGLGAVGWTLAAHHLPFSPEELGIAIHGLSGVLFVAAVVWILYLALEPFVRRLWPHALISWSRLLAVGTRDPVVARDLLVGLAAGGVVACLIATSLRLPGWLGRAPTDPTWNNVALDGLLGLRYSLSSVVYQPLASVGVAMGSFLILALTRLLLRREWLAALFYVAVFGTIEGLRWDLPLVWSLPLAWLIVAEFVWIALRFGLLAFVMLSFATGLMVSLTTTIDLSSWTSEPTRVMAVVVIGLALYAFHGVRTTARFGPAAR